MSELIPPRRGEFFTPDGIPTHRFITWIESLTTANNTNTSSIVELGVRESYPWPQPLAEIAQNDSARIFTGSERQQDFRAVSVSIDYVMTDYDFVNAKGGSLITFPEFPAENSVVIIRNGDGSKIKMSGNGRTINGSDSGTIRREGTSILFQYFINDNAWFAR